MYIEKQNLLTGLENQLESSQYILLLHLCQHLVLFQFSKHKRVTIYLYYSLLILLLILTVFLIMIFLLSLVRINHGSKSWSWPLGLRRIGHGVSDRCRAIHAKRYIESSNFFEKIMINLKKIYTSVHMYHMSKHIT